MQTLKTELKLIFWTSVVLVVLYLQGLGLMYILKTFSVN